MGWFDGFKRIKDPVRGSAQVVSTTRAPQNATSGNCRMHLVVSVPGHQAFATGGEFLIRVKKWPSPGQTLPIVASQADPTRFKILWDEIPNWDQQASAQAAQLAAAINEQQQPSPPQGGPTYQPYQPYQPGQPGTPGQPGVPGTPMVMINGRPASSEELQRYEAMTGMDLDGDGKIAGGAPASADGLQGLIASAMGGMQHPPPPDSTNQPGPADDRVAALERLAALKESGVITEAEFDAEKARILGA